MSLTDVDFAKLIKQANLILEDNEKSEIKSQLSEALDAVRVLDELDTSKTETLSQPISDLSNVFREDEVKPSLPLEFTLGQGKIHKNYFMVKSVFESQDN